MTGLRVSSQRRTTSTAPLRTNAAMVVKITTVRSPMIAAAANPERMAMTVRSRRREPRRCRAEDRRASVGGSPRAIQGVVFAVVEPANAGSIKTLFADFEPGPDKCPVWKLLDGEADRICGASEPSVADRPCAQGATRKELRLGVVVKGCHLIAGLSAVRGATESPEIPTPSNGRSVAHVLSPDVSKRLAQQKLSTSLMMNRKNF